MENGLYHVNWYGYNKNYPPSNEDELLEFTRKIREPDVAVDFYSKAKRVTPLVPYRDVCTQRVRCEQYENWPENYILMGDSMANFTPLYAQGMTFAALSGEKLSKVLETQEPGHLKGFSKQYNKTVSPILELCWAMAAGEDFCVPGVQSNTKPPSGFWFMHNYVDYAIKAVCQTGDTKLHFHMMKLMQMMSPPQYMFHPRVVCAVLKMFIATKLGKK